MSLTDLFEELEAAKDPKSRAYGGYMRHQIFLSRRCGARKKINSNKKYFPEAKKTKIIDWDFVDTCWRKEPREYQYVAANYLKAMQSYLKDSDLPS